jgi:ATP-dependent RNA helicase DDX5/DBP2
MSQVTLTISSVHWQHTLSCYLHSNMNRLSGSLRTDGYSAVAIHGDRSQSDRDRAMDDFRRGRCSLLVATDVASRGLDVKDIRMVM